MILTHLTISSSDRPQKETARQSAQYSSSSYRSSNVMDKYIRNIRAMNKVTANEYYSRLTTFQHFITNDNTTLDNLIIRIREGRDDPYDVLSNYIIYLQNNYNISAGTLKARIITAKNFLEYYDLQ